MRKKIITIGCILTVLATALVQIVLACNLNFLSEKVVFLEDEIVSQQKIKQQRLTDLAQKSKLSKVNDFARSNGFTNNPDTLVLSDTSSFAYNW